MNSRHSPASSGSAAVVPAGSNLNLSAHLAGQLILRPGASDHVPAVQSSRQDWVARLSPGQPAAQWPGLVATVFSLCGGAHRWAASQAITAAQGKASTKRAPSLESRIPASRSLAPISAEDRLKHQLATAREQVLRISQEWPALLPGEPAAPDAALILRSCPLWREDWPMADRLSALPAWLEQKWLGQPVNRWLAAYEQSPEAFADAWMRSCETPLARLMRRQVPACRQLPTVQADLPLLSQAEATMPELAASLFGAPSAGQASFAMQPHWHGMAFDTGPWNRMADSLKLPATNAASRLWARLVEALRLSQEAGCQWLAMGSLNLAPGWGIAWIEMARGLLIHSVKLQMDGASSGPAATLQSARVLAPTEWNFHPQGPLAQALRQLPSGASAAELEASARRLAVAFDPCVAFEVELPHA